VLESGRYILGEEVAGFEHEFGAYIGQRHGIGVASGTDALVLGLKALDLPPDSYVATVSHTAVATVAAIELAGLKPLLLDIERDTMTLDPKALARALEKPPGKISAVIPVHLYGQAADLGAILPLAAKHGLKLIEDCAQCHGASLGGKRLGSFGDLSCFSFYPTKNLGAFGDGGAVLAGDPGLAARLTALREYGWHARYVSERPGMNSRLDELQAAVLRVKLADLDASNARRASIADRYDRGLKDTGLVLPARRKAATHVFHQYVVRTAKRTASRPVIVKLSPNVTSIAQMAYVAQEAGADAISLVNTFVAMAIDAETRRPRIATVAARAPGASRPQGTPRRLPLAGLERSAPPPLAR